MSKHCITRPPMGWNSWDCYGASVREEEIRQNADFIAKFLKPYGYEYVTVDIQWSEPYAGGTAYRNLAKLCMDEYGRLIPAENRFPSSKGGKGFAPLAEYVHSLGLKFAIHIMRGIPREACYLELPVKGTNVTAREVGIATSTCRWNGDMYGVADTPEGQAYYNSLFELYASWGVDYVKVDDLTTPHLHVEEVKMVRNAIDACGRDMVFSASPGETELERAEECVQYLNMWRVSDDFWDDWSLLVPQFKRMHDWNPYRNEDSYPDADMIPIGMLSMRANSEINKPRHSNLSYEESKTLMTLWCIARSPLILGMETTLLTEEELALLTNEQAIALDQKGKDCRQVSREGDCIIWRSKVDDTVYAAVFNIGEEAAAMTVPFAECDAPLTAAVSDVWSGEALGQFENEITLEVPAHGSRLIRFN